MDNKVIEGSVILSLEEIKDDFLKINTSNGQIHISIEFSEDDMGIDCHHPYLSVDFYSELEPESLEDCVTEA